MRYFLGLSLLICSSMSMAKTVYFQFQHLEASPDQQKGLAPYLCMRIEKDFHGAGQECLGSKHNVSPDLGIAPNHVLQDHVSGLGVFGEYNFTLVCNQPSLKESKKTITFLQVYNDGTREIDISASCPVDEHGHLLAPRDLQIVRKK